MDLWYTGGRLRSNSQSMTFNELTKGILVDTDNCSGQFKLKKSASFELKSTKSLEEAQLAVSRGSVDFVIVHEPLNVHGLDLIEAFRRNTPTVPMILLCASASSTWSEAVKVPEVELVSSSASMTELTYRISKLLSLKLAKEKEIRPRVFVDPLPSLRNSNSGRLDAELIAKAFGLTLKDMAKAIDKPYTSVHKTTDSQSIQELLLPFERVASALNSITDGKLELALKIWLNAPNKAFPTHIPIDLVKQGRINILADSLEDVLLGHPD